MTIPRPSSRTLNIFPKRQARRSMLPSDGSAITKTSPAFVPRKTAKYSCSRLGVVCFVSFVYEARAMEAILVDELRKDRAIAWRLATEKQRRGWHLLLPQHLAGQRMLELTCFPHAWSQFRFNQSLQRRPNRYGLPTRAADCCIHAQEQSSTTATRAALCR